MVCCSVVITQYLYRWFQKIVLSNEITTGFYPMSTMGAMRNKHKRAG